MATTSYHLNRIVSSRYIKETDVELFLKTIRTLQSLHIKVNPSIKVYRTTSPTKRSLDILFDTGVRAKDINGKICGNSIFLQSIFSNSYYHDIILKMPLPDFQSYTKETDYARSVFNDIAECIISNVDASVELRSIR